MNSKELVKELKRYGATFTNQGKGGHITAVIGDKKTQVPTHGSRKELGTGLVRKIYKDLGIKK